jgi:DNA-binding MarR family transcriptional regulator
VTTKKLSANQAVEEISAAMQALVQAASRTRRHEKIASEAGVPLGKAGIAVLFALHTGEDRPRLRDLAERLGHEAPAVSRQVAALEQAGLVARVDDPDDRRACLLELTDEGRAVFERFGAARRAHLTAILAGWPAEDRATFARLVRRFADDLITHEETHL